MRVGIVGFGGVGKTTIFNALTGLSADTGGGGRGRENTGVIKVPDPRIAALAELHRSKKQVLAEIVFVDPPGAREGQAAGGAMAPDTLQAMQGCEALVAVLRDFANPALARPPDAARELADFSVELIISDLGPLENRRDRMKKEAGRDKEKAVIERCIAHLADEQPLRTLSLDDADLALLSGFGLLSRKPLLCLLNQE
ncbi:MAG: GTPase, partial [bacterium]